MWKRKRADRCDFFSDCEITKKMKYVNPMKLFRELERQGSKGRGRLLGLDVGDKYVGLAVSGSLNKIASPLSVLHRKKSNIDCIASELQTLVSDLSLVGFVVGYPFQNQKESVEALQVKTFVEDLCRTGKLEVLRYTYWNEGFSSKSNELLMKPFNCAPINSKTVSDKFAAVSILEDYLDHFWRMVQTKHSPK